MSSPSLRRTPPTYYERFKVAKGANRAKVAKAHRLLTIAFQILRDERAYERRAARPEGRSHPSRLPQIAC
jgi:hypothetical protein